MTKSSSTLLAAATLLALAGPVRAAEPPAAPTPAPALASRFDRADSDGDGRLNEKEAKAAGFFARSSFGESDRDHDGQVTLFELGKSVQSSLQQWLDHHDKADADKDGYVSKAEAGDGPLTTVFERADRDHDGRLGRDELMDDVTHGYYSETATQPVVPNIIDERF
jgi:Ca2+-binding EF-hand superfamily protein